MKHPATGDFQSLITGANRFEDVEQRIEALPTRKERGDALEVFAEAYLRTIRATQIKEVWPETTIPPSLKQRYLLPTRDKGADGLVQLTNGEYHTYQVKFRTGRPNLTWAELATFVGISSEAQGQFVLTNSEALPIEATDRDVYSISGFKLDQLTREDLEQIGRCITGESVERKTKKPKPNQEKAVQEILTAFQETDRAQAIMACGTGKTLVGLWAMEQIPENGRILVLLPSLALLSQTLEEYIRETSWARLPAICVCSDPTVTRGADRIVMEQADLSFQVSTDAADVQEFLGRPLTRHVVFSTYQSARVVAEGMDNRPFDLAIFDEAHKTATRGSTAFAFALDDDNISIKKRLFMTATPRHYKISKRTKEGEFTEAYSMGDEAVFGKRAYNLPFAEAVEADLICPFKVVISVVTTEMLRPELEVGETVIDYQSVKSQAVARQVALQKALEKHALKKIITFHNRVSSAQDFASDSPEGMGRYAPGFQLMHVNGKQKVSERKGTLKEFQDVDRTMISNAGCLTEGVDLPAVDMVAFMSPKHSRVDIVQAVGRAMRKPANSDKQFGYVFIPLFVDVAEGETNEEAVERTEFGDVWNVLQAMQEQDSGLATVIEELRVQQGRGVKPDFDRLGEFLEVLGPEVALSEIRRGVEVQCLERLGVTWDFRYGELAAYKEVHGNCDVPQTGSENPQLRTWIQNQRTFYAKGKSQLSEERVQRLNALGFVWNPTDAAWEEMFEALKAYKKSNGHCTVPRDCPENPQLGRWVNTQRSFPDGRRLVRRIPRKAYKKGKLSADRIRRLEEIGAECLWGNAGVTSGRNERL